MHIRVALLTIVFGAAFVAAASAQVLFDEDDAVGIDYRDGSSGSASAGDELTLLAGNKLPVADSAFSGSTSGRLEYRHTPGGSWELLALNDDLASLDLREADSIVVYLNGPAALAGGELPRLGLQNAGGERAEPLWLSSPSNIRIAASSGFTDTSPTNAILTSEYVETLPKSLRRPGYPEDLVITFSDAPLDTSIAGIGAPATPSNFRVETAGSEQQLDFRFRDLNGDMTLSATGEYIDVLTPIYEGASAQSPTWRFALVSAPAGLVPPGAGDTYEFNVVFNEFALDDDPATWQRISFSRFDLGASDALLSNVVGVYFLNGGVNPEVRTLWFDRVEAITNDDEAFLDEVQEATFAFFWNEANPANGLVRDRLGGASSIAAVGFGLSAYTVGIDRGWITREQGIQRVLNTLRFFWNAPQGPGSSNVTGYKGFFYHFLDMNTGLRRGTTELSTIDTALLLGGVVHTGEYFDGDSADEEEIRALADSIYYRVDWQWAVNNVPLVTLSWKPEVGYSNFDWRGYNEAMIIYILGIGSPTYPLDPASWNQWTSTYRWETHYGYSYVPFPPLFGHQYTHTWVDFRGIQDDYMRGRGIDYFENSRRATLAQRAYHIANPRNHANYSRDEWGLTASDYPSGYIARGAPPAQNDEGTIAPTAPGGSVPFAPNETIAVLRTIRKKYPAMFAEYGFKDAYNATQFWYSNQYLGIDEGPIILMIENHRTGAIWDSFMQNEDIQRGLQLAGFRETPTDVEDAVSPDVPTAPVIVSAYPNPFGVDVTIRLSVPNMATTSRIRVEVFDVLGRRIASLVERHLEGGVHNVRWAPRGVANGVYFIRVASSDTGLAGGSAATHTVVLAR